MIHQTLHEGWRMRATSGPVPENIADRTIPAQVPGSTHLDLLAEGLIPDPYLDTAETELAWTHRTEWRYELDFHADARSEERRVGKEWRLRRCTRLERKEENTMSIT